MRSEGCSCCCLIYRLSSLLLLFSRVSVSQENRPFNATASPVSPPAIGIASSYGVNVLVRNGTRVTVTRHVDLDYITLRPRGDVRTVEEQRASDERYITDVKVALIGRESTLAADDVDHR